MHGVSGKASEDAVNRPFSFQVKHQFKHARLGELVTPHGVVTTPIFMPVGTVASVKSLDARDLVEMKAQIILANTYHLFLRPGAEQLQQTEGIHDFMNWQQPILTDSGGFQVFSLGVHAKAKNSESSTRNNQSRVQISDDGVQFKAHHDGTEYFFTPERAIEIQRQIGADIIMTFDEAMSDDYTAAEASISVTRTHQWARQCYDYWQQHQRLSRYGKYQALFGIIQGGTFPDLRKKSAKFISNIDFDGIAIGGETVGYNMEGTKQLIDWIRPLLPPKKPIYTMGLGRDPQDIIDAVLTGADMFDCVGPTRLARNGAVYVGEFKVIDDVPQFVSEHMHDRINIGKKQFASDRQVINPGCDCYTCSQRYSRSYLHHLYRTKELSYYRLASIHNLRTMLRITEQLKDWITAHAQVSKKATPKK